MLSDTHSSGRCHGSTTALPACTTLEKVSPHPLVGENPPAAFRHLLLSPIKRVSYLVTRLVSCLIFQMHHSFFFSISLCYCSTHMACARPNPFYTIRYLLNSTFLASSSRSHPSSTPAQAQSVGSNQTSGFVGIFGQPTPLWLHHRRRFRPARPVRIRPDRATPLNRNEKRRLETDSRSTASSFSVHRPSGICTSSITSCPSPPPNLPPPSPPTRPTTSPLLVR